MSVINLLPSDVVCAYSLRLHFTSISTGASYKHPLRVKKHLVFVFPSCFYCPNKAN